MLVLWAAMFVQCGAPRHKIIYADVNMREWIEPAEVVLAHKGSAVSGNLSLALHINSTFTADTLSFEIIVKTPDSLRYAEQIKFPVEMETSCDSARVEDLLIPYRRNVRFEVAGDYIITLRPLVPLRGVEAAGVNFQETEN